MLESRELGLRTVEWRIRLGCLSAADLVATAATSRAEYSHKRSDLLRHPREASALPCYVAENPLSTDPGTPTHLLKHPL
jgi:hypothetical protein